MFTIATRHKNRLYDEIYCFADDQAERDEWIAVFWRMGVSILHLREASGARVDVPLDDRHAPRSVKDQARWASAAGVALQRQQQELVPASPTSCTSPSPPAARCSPVSLWTPIPEEIPEAKDCLGPHAGHCVHDAPTWERSESDLSSASTMALLPDEHCDNEEEERNAPAWPKLLPTGEFKRKFQSRVYV